MAKLPKGRKEQSNPEQGTQVHFLFVVQLVSKGSGYTQWTLQIEEQGFVDKSIEGNSSVLP